MTCALGLIAVVVATAAGAAPRQTDVEINIGASLNPRQAALVPNGTTVTMTRRAFYVLVDVALITPTPGGQLKIRAEIGGGLRWGADGPDPSESCTATDTTGECTTPDLQPVAGQSGSGWFWDVVAPANGTYTFEAAILQAPHADPVSTNNASRITIVVNEPTGGSSGGGGSGGGGSGGGATETARATAAKLSPAAPKAGAAFKAIVTVSAGGSPLRPTGVGCRGTVGRTTLLGIGTGRSGSATCLYRTPLSARGKTVRGVITFTARGATFTRRFSAKLR